MSRKMIWIHFSSSVKIPGIDLTVVCGRGDIALTRSPIRAFRSVDFPALGRPTMATYQTLGIEGCYNFSVYLFAKRSNSISILILRRLLAGNLAISACREGGISIYYFLDCRRFRASATFLRRISEAFTGF